MLEGRGKNYLLLRRRKKKIKFSFRHVVCFCCFIQLCFPQFHNEQLAWHSPLSWATKKRSLNHQAPTPIASPQHRRLFLSCASVLLLDDGCSDSPQWLITRSVRALGNWALMYRSVAMLAECFSRIFVIFAKSFIVEALCRPSFLPSTRGSIETLSKKTRVAACMSSNNCASATPKLFVNRRSRGVEFFTHTKTVEPVRNSGQSDAVNFLSEQFMSMGVCERTGTTIRQQPSLLHGRIVYEFVDALVQRMRAWEFCVGSCEQRAFDFPEFHQRASGLYVGRGDMRCAIVHFRMVSVCPCISRVTAVESCFTVAVGLP